MKKLDIVMMLVLICAISTVSFTSFAAECDAVRQETLRLHIIANSDSAEDQALKLLIRDRILEKYGAILGRSKSLQSAIESAEALSGRITETAEEVALGQGYDYKVNVQITHMYFPTRVYEQGVTLPAGHYNALRVVIGEGVGKNWWCVMYPPLCIPAATAGEASELEDRIKNLNEYHFVPKFAVVELFEGLNKD